MWQGDTELSLVGMSLSTEVLIANHTSYDGLSFRCTRETQASVEGWLLSQTQKHAQSQSVMRFLTAANCTVHSFFFSTCLLNGVCLPSPHATRLCL